MSEKTQPNELALAIQSSGLQENTIENLMKSFSQSFNDARIVVDSAKEIVVTDENDIEGMKLAREKRLELKKIRTTVENIRKDLKEQALREGKAIDGAANIIKALIAPVEEHLEKQEKFAEVKAMERLEEKYTDRIKQLQMYVDDVTVYSLKEMSDDAFSKLLESSKSNWQAKKDAEEKAEADRIEQEKKVKLYDERRLLIAPFRDFVSEDMPKLGVDSTEEEFQKMLKQLQIAKQKHDEEVEKTRLENEQLKKDREEQQKKIEAANKEKLEAENKLKEQKRLEEQKELEEKKRIEDERRLEEEKIAKEKADQEEKKRQALLAPDKFKLIELAKTIVSIELPAVSSKEAGDVVKEVERVIGDLNTYILNKAKAL